MQVKVFELRYIEVKKSARQRIAKAISEGLCVACLQPLDETRTIRGCHERCHRATLRAIQSGRTTDADRVEEGKLLEGKPGGRRASNPVTAELE